MNKYISRGIKILVFVSFIVLIDQIFGFFLRYFYFKQIAGQNYTLTYAFKECKSDILIFGASQAQSNYDTRIISDSFKMSCFNAGQNGGHSILLQNAQIEVITKRYVPKAIILEFNPKNVVRFPGDYDRLQILLPYYKCYPELRPLMCLRSPYEKIKLLSAIYPFNSNIINIIRFNTNSNAARKKDFEGYVPIKNKTMSIDLQNNKPKTISNNIIDNNMLNALKNIISICKEKKLNYLLLALLFFTKQNLIWNQFLLRLN